MVNRKIYTTGSATGKFTLPLLVAILLLSILGFENPKQASAASNDVGYRGFSFGNTGTSSPTGEKPESKLWWNDGSWWGSLYNNASQTYHIYKLNLGTQTWSDTGVVLDNRGLSKSDILWDTSNQKLYVASHVYASTSASSVDSTQWCRLYKYSYNTVTKTYSLDTGFPVNICQSITETMALAKDSTGRLWITYAEANSIKVNHSTTDDLTWGTPYILPVTGSSNLSSDDISSVIAFQGNKIGILWSNQSDKKDYFAVHLDANADNIWEVENTALPGPNCSSITPCADDHINLKTDSAGRLYAAVKTSLSGSTLPLIMLMVRDTNGAWNSYIYSTVADNQTRPLVIMDEEHGKLYMFANGTGIIYFKVTDLNNIQFAPGPGDIFISSTVDLNINNPASTKQNVNGTTGLIVMAGDTTSKFYWHNFINLNAGSPTSTATSSPTPTNTFLPTSTLTNTPLPTNTSVPTATHTNTPVPTDTAVPTATHTNTPLPTATSTDIPATATSTGTAVVTDTPTNIPLITDTPSATPLATDTSIPATPTFTPVATDTSTSTPIVQTATFTSTPLPTSTPANDVIFADGFEAGNLSAWTSSSTNGGNLSVSPSAVLSGSFGLQGIIANNNSMYLTDDKPNAETHYRARFYFDPNSIVMASSDAHYILQGITGSSTVVIRVEFRYYKGAYMVRGKAINDSGIWLTTAWITISDAPHAIELEVRTASASGATDGLFNFWVDGLQKGNLTGIANFAQRIDRVRIGAVNGVDVGTRGTYYLDAFESRRQTYIGP